MKRKRCAGTRICELQTICNEGKITCAELFLLNPLEKDRNLTMTPIYVLNRCRQFLKKIAKKSLKSAQIAPLGNGKNWTKLSDLMAMYSSSLDIALSK